MKGENKKETIDFFYRDIGKNAYNLSSSSVFTHSTEAQKKRIVRVVLQNKYIGENMFFSEESKQWKPYSYAEYYDTHDTDSSPLFLEYAEESCFPALPDAIKRDRDAQYIEDYTAEQIEAYLCYRKDKARAQFAAENALDENKIPKNIFAYEITTDKKNLCVKIKAHSFIAVKTPVETQTCGDGEESATIVFDMKTGKVKSEGKAFDLPLNVSDFALEKLLEVAKCFTGVKIQAKKSDTAKENIETMKDLTHLPFEHSLYKVLTSDYTKDLGFLIDRKNSTIYRDFCKKAKIRNYRMLRKAYNLRPDSLLTYMRVKSCGFRDLNIFNRVLSEQNLYTLFDNSCRKNTKTNLMFFCKKCIKAHGELKAINLLSKVNINIYDSRSDYIFEDSITMFHRYFRYIPKNVLTEIFHDGFTKNTHDALSEISYKKENKNCIFHYSEAQKAFEDDIDGYSFRLPRDSYTLCDIGIKMHNCVASYTDAVLSGNSTILYAQKDGEYALCIELSGNEAIQELTLRNAEPTEEQSKVLSKWHCKHNIKA